MDLKRRMRERILDSLAVDCDLMAGFDEEHRADNNHHLRTAAYGVAFGVFGPLEDSPLKGREEAWQTALRMFDRLCEWQGEDGLWTASYPHLRKSEPSSYPWSVYSWLRTLQDFGEHFGPDRRARVERMLRLAMLQRVKWAQQDLSKGIRHANNIFVHLTLELWMGGKIFGDESWTNLATETLETCFATQLKDGYWPDTQPHRGPAMGYNTVILSAASAYARMSGSATALQAVRRAADFHRWLSYPDGSIVETMDERNRYGGPGGTDCLMWCLAPFETTRPVAALFAGKGSDSSRKAAGAPLDAILIDAWAATPEGDVAPAEAASGSKRFPTLPAVVVRRGPWYACLSAATTRVPGGHWHHDLQNHLSLWHDAVGLAVGGGNSLHAPLFSTFRFHGQYLADTGEAEARGAGAALTLRYGGAVARLELAFENDGAAVLSARAEGDLPPDSEFAFHLPGLYGQGVHMPGGGEAPLTDWAFWSVVGSQWSVAGGGRSEGTSRFRVGALSVECDRPMRILWPCEPVSIYNVPARLPVKEAVLRVSAGISDGPAVFRLRVESK